MTEVMQGLVSEAKKCKFSTIGQALSEEDVVSVWDNVSDYVQRQMSLQKGVHIPGLGIFSFSQKKLDIGNNKFILVQRPIFVLSEKFSQTHGLNYQKHHTPGQIPIVQLNFAALAIESPFDRDVVESCVKEVLQALNRSVAAKRNVEFSFSGIGRLQIRDNRVKMKFFKDFINSMDGSGHLVDALQNRPGTVDSVISNRSPSRLPTPNTLHLPRISNGFSGLQPEKNVMPTIQEDCSQDNVMEMAPAEELDMAVDDVNDVHIEIEDTYDEKKPLEHKAPSRVGSRLVAPLATASGVCFHDDLLKPMSPLPSPPNKATGSPAPLEPLPDFPKPPGATGDITLTPLLKPPSPPSDNKPLMPPTPPSDVKPSDMPLRPKSLEKLSHPTSPPRSACGHHNAGQELCYLCHQRERKNIPVSFAEERSRREMEEDRLLQQFQQLKDTEAILKDQAETLVRRHENQKMAAFNLGVSEAVKTKKIARPTDFHPSYIFQKRPLTPPRLYKQADMHKELAKQVVSKKEKLEKLKSDEQFLERLEQVQLAEDLAAQREQYLRGKAEQQEQYKRALSAQVKFKPLPIPAREPDSSSPIFGTNDMTNEKLAEQRLRAQDLYKQQVDTVAQRKRDAILKRLIDQKEEEEVLRRTKDDLFNDRANRYERMFTNRKKLEKDWSAAVQHKLNREQEDKIRSLSPGVLLHEQCDKYHRCRQCKRTLGNCGESNIWCDSRYIPGSRLIV